MNSKRITVVVTLLIGLLFAGGVFLLYRGRPSADVFSVGGAGQLDSTFGSGGIVQTDFDKHNDDAQIARLTSDGKLVVAGTQYSSQGVPSLEVARYLPDGTLDTTFGTGGKVSYPKELANFSMADFIIADDGSLVFTGSYPKANPANSNFALVRLKADGSLDHFGTDAIVTTALSNDLDGAQAVVEQNGKFLVTGCSSNFTAHTAQVAMVRYNLDGSLDTSFHDGGKWLFGAHNLCGRIFVKKDGTMIVAGIKYSMGGTGYDTPILTFYTADGMLDTTHGTNGVIDLTDGKYNINRFVFSSDEQFLYGTGEQCTVDPCPSYQNLVYRVATIKINLTSGSLDQTFGTNGVTTTDFAKSTQGHDIALQSNGDLVVGGETGAYPDLAYALVRYLPTGQLDTTFGTNGVVTTTFPNHGALTSLMIDTHDNIFVLGSTQPGNNQPMPLPPPVIPGTAPTAIPTTSSSPQSTNDFLIVKYLGTNTQSASVTITPAASSPASSTTVATTPAVNLGNPPVVPQPAQLPAVSNTNPSSAALAPTPLSNQTTPSSVDIATTSPSATASSSPTVIAPLSSPSTSSTPEAAAPPQKTGLQKLSDATTAADANAAASQAKSEAQDAYNQRITDLTNKKNADLAAAPDKKTKTKITSQFSKDKAAASKTLTKAKKAVDIQLKAKLKALGKKK